MLKDRKIQLKAAVSSSRKTSDALKAIGIPETDLNAEGDLDLYIDGADEANARGVLIKGGGAALTREKIIAAASRKFVCIIDESKLVERLGAFPLPVEVIPMARSYVARQLVKLGGTPVWREGTVTDNGNVILDVHGLRLDDPAAMQMEDAINGIAGVVTVGLFAHRRADVLLVAGDARCDDHHTRARPRSDLEAGADLDDPAGGQAVVIGDDLRAARHLHECPAAQRRQIRALTGQELLAAQEIGGALRLVRHAMSFRLAQDLRDVGLLHEAERGDHAHDALANRRHGQPLAPRRCAAARA